MRRAIALVAICSAFATSAHTVAAQPAVDQDRFLVIPFDNLGHEARIFWLAEASAIMLADNLNAIGRHTYTREERLEAFEQLQVPGAASLSHATVIRLGQVVGATHVVIGSLTLDGTRISVRAQDIRLDTGRLESEVVETGALDDLFVVFARLARRLSGLPAVSAGPAASALGARTPSLQVFENYVKGLLATSTPTKVGYLQSALKLDPSFDRARLALWAVNQDTGNAQAALLASAAVPETSPLYARARFSSALSLIQLKRLDDAFATLKTLADRAPSATLMNNLGIIQLRRSVTPQTGKPAFTSTRPSSSTRRTRTTPSTSDTHTGWITMGRARSTGCARQSGGSRRTVRRTPCCQRRCNRSDRRRRPVASASLPRSYQRNPWMPRRAAWSASRRPLR